MISKQWRSPPASSAPVSQLEVLGFDSTTVTCQRLMYTLFFFSHTCGWNKSKGVRALP
jgi:hypothetical protein